MPPPIRRTARHAAGFTLIELLVVITILGTLATIVVVNVTEAQRQSDLDNTALQTQRVRQDVLTWMQLRRKGRGIPQSLRELTDPPPYLREVPTDVWGQELELVALADDPLARFAIRSAGPDGQPDTEDDIVAR